MKILGIESSCDETGIAIVEDGRRVIVQGLSSQADIHARFGGVVPEIASRQHLLTFPSLLRDVMQRHDGDLNLDAIAVTYGPGLAGSLLVGVNFAKALAMVWNLPLYGVHHLEGHVYANWITRWAVGRRRKRRSHFARSRPHRLRRSHGHRSD